MLPKLDRLVCIKANDHFSCQIQCNNLHLAPSLPSRSQLNLKHNLCCPTLPKSKIALLLSTMVYVLTLCAQYTVKLIPLKILAWGHNLSCLNPGISIKLPTLFWPTSVPILVTVHPVLALAKTFQVDVKTKVVTFLTTKQPSPQLKLV